MPFSLLSTTRSSAKGLYHMENVILTVNNLLLSLADFLSHLPEDLLLDCLKISTVADLIYNKIIIISWV